ncbi:hypothetical protein DYB30_007408 [Aphanomyces astaci]|uniref:Uncharacterized protein n=2 Tax=Aphanomyces astaci TaxID=112090 RepID=A0A397CGK6_APHAT|nr:hypothetical protein DYB30_007408 [Aphanomyces astaci]
MVASPTTNVADDKRRFECLRKRRYRAAKRSELKMLEEEVGDLMERLRFMQAKYYSTTSAPPQSAPRLRHRLLHHPPHPVVASVHERLVYYTHYNYRLGTTSLTISGRFQHGSRVVVAHMLVAHDECLPLAPGDLRPYGFGWTVYEPVSHGITLVRYSMLQCTPLTSQGTVMTLNEIGRLFGLPSRGVESADAYVDAIAAAAEENLVRTHMPAIRGFCLDLEKSDVDENSGA